MCGSCGELMIVHEGQILKLIDVWCRVTADFHERKGTREKLPKPTLLEFKEVLVIWRVGGLMIPPIYPGKQIPHSKH